MKNPIFLFFMLMGMYACSSNLTVKQDSSQTPNNYDTGECSNLYPFDGYYINLDDYNSLLIDGVPSKDFKNCSKYAHRFAKPFSDKVTIDGKDFTIYKNKSKREYLLIISEGDKITNRIKFPVPEPLPEVHEYYFNLFPYAKDVVVVMEDMYSTHYVVCKYDLNGKELLRKEIEHTFLTHPEPNTDYHHRYLHFRQLTSSQLIFSSQHGFSEKSKTVVLSLDDFTVSEYDKTAHGIILDEEDKNLKGFITQVESQFSVHMIDNSKYEFAIENANSGMDVILKNDLLFIANFHPIATGSSLFCYDLKSGKMKWQADVKQLMVSHSEYHNNVTISMYKNKIIMEGIEAEGKYVQIFDAETAKRLAVFGSFLK